MANAPRPPFHLFWGPSGCGKSRAIKTHLSDEKSMADLTWDGIKHICKGEFRVPSVTQLVWEMPSDPKQCCPDCYTKLLKGRVVFAETNQDPRRWSIWDQLAEFVTDVQEFGVFS